MALKRKTLVAVIIVPIQVVLAALAWRDLARREDDQVRGSKRAWRIFVAINPGNALIYWLFGRRKARPYWAYSAGCFVVWAMTLAVAAACPARWTGNQYVTGLQTHS